MMKIVEFIFIVSILCSLIWRIYCVEIQRGTTLKGLLFALKNRAFHPPEGQKDPSQIYRFFSCAEREDGLYPDIVSECRNYFRCLSSATYSYRCGHGEKFDPTANECQQEEKVECPSVPKSPEKCHKQSDGYYPNYDDGCASFYSCRNGLLQSESSCENGIWDIATWSCHRGLKATCSPPSCLGLQDGRHPLDGSNCAAFYLCNKGQKTDMLCPMHSIFDYRENECVSRSKAVCYENVCANKPTGLYSSAANLSCKSYFRCFNGNLINLDECKSGYIFNGKRCIRETNFTCWDNDNNDDCRLKISGYHPSNDKDCRGFYYCQHQNLIKKFRCKKGYVFNGKICIYSKHAICKPQLNFGICYFQKDGYYTIQNSECKNFYKCEKGNRISEHRCPEGLVFSGEHCVSSRIYDCSNKFSRSRSILYSNGV